VKNRPAVPNAGCVNDLDNGNANAVPIGVRTRDARRAPLRSAVRDFNGPHLMTLFRK
jgi:hypothetical protein